MDEEINVKGTNNEKAPYGKDKELRSRLKQFAEKHNLIISDFVEKKIRFSESHYGVCFCDPLRRLKCPCDNIWEDFKAYGNRCLCRVLWKPDAYDKWLKTKQKQKTLSDVKIKSSVKKTKEEKQNNKKIIDNVWRSLG